MADEYTPNFDLFLPKETDLMSDVRKNLTNSFEKLSTQAEPTVIAAGGALPQAGTYEVGDRVCRIKAAADSTDYTSSYILAAKDSSWGYFWRPIQKVIAPWVTVPNAAYFDLAAWGPHATAGVQYAMDNKGLIHFRGAITYAPAGGIPANTTFTIFKDLPELVRPAYAHLFNGPISPVGSTTGLAGFKSSRILFGNTGTIQVRGFNTLSTQTNVWFGHCAYPAGTKMYYSA
jgi:hypothetical protein